ncbi:MAG: AtpZ/AtpI family protein [Solidesulfovibrio sp.]|uniref:AtpZ/AtpI family protein n=1 Tax=Solidesulfovibrio sp. TaxID=2910990 RepID=UPI002B1E99D3|nr:AtpZ/AtpI family protein [Solidesulfovibrio sp.]MEA4855681.1 AtpZ/AtpI family protein [Solidesulfovibrio sp.]
MFGRLIKDKSVRESIASASVVGLNLVSATFVGLFIGWWLDRWLDTKPWLLLTFLVLGIAAGFKNVMIEVRKIQKADAGEREGQDGDDQKPEG